MEKLVEKSVDSDVRDLGCNGTGRCVYSPPKHTMIGDVVEITQSNGNKPPLDGETTVQGLS